MNDGRPRVEDHATEACRSGLGAAADCRPRHRAGEIGEMRSSRDGLGLAVLRIEPVREGKTLAAGEATLLPVGPAWMRLEDEISP
jgi:hypothetical protein